MGDSTRAWLDSLKVGDRVGIVGSGTDSFAAIRRIEAIQKLHFVVSGTESKYRRDNGRVAGARGSWSWTDLVPTDEPFLVARLLANRLRHLRGEIERAANACKDEAVLSAALALLKPAEVEKVNG